MITRVRSAIMLAFIAIMGCLQMAAAATAADNSTRYITYQNPDGTTQYLKDDRRPSLYTRNFGDCLGNSLVNVTRFDAAYYKDNMTILFDLEGASALTNESVMLYIGVYAYGESRFDLTFNPCQANIASLCPMNSSVPITANGLIPVSQSDVALIPSIALTIPDFEGQAILRIFANSTESEIGCYSAVLTNGKTFSHPKAVGTVLGVFTFIAMLASFATAIYGEAVPTMRLHYAHSLSVGVVFAVFQHIFYTGALSMNWPSVLVAFWSNFAWAGGMIHSNSMQRSIDNLIGNNIGNTSQVGAAPAGSTQEDLGGGYDISQIYKRFLGPAVRSAGKRAANHPLMHDIASEIYDRDYSILLKRDVLTIEAQRSLQARALANSSTGHYWYGHPVAEGLPLPGNYSGFAGTLAEEEIRVSNAFMTGFLWFLILLVLLVAATMAFKWVVEGLVRIKALKQDRLAYFRQHWLGYSASVALRTCFLAWFMIMFLTIFQFTYESSGGVKAVAAIVFILFFVGMPLIAVYACWYKIRLAGHNSPARYQTEQRKLFGKIPWFRLKKVDTEAAQPQQPEEMESETKSGGMPFWKRMSSSPSVTETVQSKSIHDDEEYTKKFGWLAGRFRRTRWWFFVFWLVYEFVRACFYGGASGHALTQVFGLLVVETLTFAFVVWARPFEGRRLNVIVVYCLGFSKVTSVALSAAFDVEFNLQRITTTIIGIVIIVIQGILTIIMLIAIVVGVFTSHMSVSRNKEQYRPRKLAGIREKYFDHLDRVVNDLPREPKPASPPEPEEPKTPQFEVRNMRRVGKIEDDDPDPVVAEFASASHMSFDQDRKEGSGVPLMTGRTSIGGGTPGRRSRAASAASMSQTSLPFGARQHRPSWSSRDLTASWNPNAGAEQAFTPVDMSQSVAEDDPVVEPSPAKGSRTPSRSRMLSRSHTPSRSATLPSKLRPAVSNDSLRTGGDVSTREMIGKVPAPISKPRAGTVSSRSSWRNSMPLHGQLDGDAFVDSAEPWNSPQNSRPLLTPALEAEEFMPRTPGLEEQKRL